MAIEHFSRITAEVAVGRCPRARERAWLAEQGLTAVVSLQSDADLAQLDLPWSEALTDYAALGIDATRVPVVDFDRLDLGRNLDAAVAAIQAQVAAGRAVYVHCNAGLNRSPSAVIAWLVAHRGMTLTEAWETVCTAHDSAPYQDVMIRWVRERGLRLR
ncbi:MAG: dual specificity protein phosphatase family protein [Myxococcales bacterium]|nr:dual specificity protein phosphatase family protein [Myxococcales bacterium]MCB9524443.1 dual specificity protein phosphatase family protein [Myxococcales bacterium]